MAIMYPDKIDCFCNKQPGEITTYVFLRDKLPNDHHVLWNIKPTDETELDFLIISPDIGLTILEVKDWLKLEQDELKYRDPKTQDLDYMKDILKKLQKCENLLQTSERYMDKLDFCYAHGVVFPNLCCSQLSNHEYYSKEPHKFLLKDELDTFNSNKLREKLYFMGTGKFTFEKLTQDEIKLIIDILLDN